MRHALISYKRGTRLVRGAITLLIQKRHPTTSTLAHTTLQKVWLPFVQLWRIAQLSQASQLQRLEQTLQDGSDQAKGALLVPY